MTYKLWRRRGERNEECGEGVRIELRGGEDRNSGNGNHPLKGLGGFRRRNRGGDRMGRSWIKFLLGEQV